MKSSAVFAVLALAFVAAGCGHPAVTAPASATPMADPNFVVVSTDWQCQVSGGLSDFHEECRPHAIFRNFGHAGSGAVTLSTLDRSRSCQTVIPLTAANQIVEAGCALNRPVANRQLPISVEVTLQVPTR